MASSTANRRKPNRRDHPNRPRQRLTSTNKNAPASEPIALSKTINVAVDTRRRPLSRANPEGAGPNGNGAGVICTDLAMMAGVATT
jgi:hypothetical protein